VEIYVMEKEATREKIADLTGHDRYKYCPIILLVCINKKRAAMKYGRKIGSYLATIDAAIAVQNMMLVAAAHDLGTSWGDVLGSQKKLVRDLLKMPENLDPFTFIPIGYPAYDEKNGGPRAERRPLKDMVHSELNLFEF
ncbi:MAG: nitroreductase family protein, partial [Candidatus Helarchaeota archaeon]